MKLKILGLLAVGLIAGPMAAQALPVTWSYSSTVTSILNPAADLPGFVTSGAPFTLSVTFDPALTILAPANCFTPGGGTGCRNRFENNSLSFTFDFGPTADCDSEAGVQPCTADPLFGRMFVFNDYSGADGFASPGDGMWFVLIGNGQRVRLQLSGDTSVFANAPTSGFFPASQPNLSGTLEVCDGDYAGAFDACYADQSQIFATATAKVPESGTLALFGLGLIGIGFARRRKTH